jgi:hypothetical protein
MASGSWGFQLLSTRQQALPPRATEQLKELASPPPTRSNKWKSSSSRVLLLTRPPTALGFRDSDMPDQATSTVDDEAEADALHDTIEDMASFLTLRVGMAMLRRQQLKRKQKEQGEELFLKASTCTITSSTQENDNALQENPLALSVGELDALESTNRFARDNLAAMESTVEDVRIAQAELGAVWEASEQAVAETTLEPERQHASVLNNSVDEATEPVTPVIFQVAPQSASEDMDQETHSLLHKKEGDRILALGDEFSGAEEASSVHDNKNKGTDFASVVPDLPLCISTDFGRPLDVLQDAVLPDVPSCISTEFGRPLDVIQDEIVALQFPFAQVKLESENPPVLDDDSSVEVLVAPVAPRAVDFALSVKAKKSAESKQRALLMARLEQEQRRREKAVESKQRALLMARLDQEQRRREKVVEEPSDSEPESRQHDDVQIPIRQAAISLARQQPKSPEDEMNLQERYGAMSLEERAFTILYDLGMIEKNADPNDEKVAETLEPERHSVLSSSVEATLAVVEESDMEPVIPVISQVAVTSESASEDMDQETHSLLHKKEGDRILALEDEFSGAEEASSVHDKGTDFAAVVPDLPLCISTDFGRPLDVLQDAVLPDVPSCISTNFGRPLDVIQDEIVALQFPFAQVKLESENPPVLDDDSSVEVAPIDNALEMIAAPVEEVGITSPNVSVAPRAVDFALSVKAKKSAESKQRALLMARLEQERPLQRR